jgi:hypothetical protein
VTFCRTIMCTQGTHISLNMRVVLVFFSFFLALRFFYSENTHIYVWANSQILLYPFLSVFCPVNRTVNRYGLT